jgi:TonB dependent receptor
MHPLIPADRWIISASLLALSTVFFSSASSAKAQTWPLDAGALDASSSQLTDASNEGDVATPPRVVTLATPAQSALDVVGSRELLIRVDTHGAARLDTCEYALLTCAQLQEALDASRFEPAQISGLPRAARVRLRFETPAVMDAGMAVGADAGVAVDAAVQDAGSSLSPLEFGATARIETLPGEHHVSLEQLREVPGTFGDPFRILEALPGVVPVISGLPYVYVRGAPPGGTAYFYDDVQMPALFHLGLGPGIIHPAMIDGVDFKAGVAPARYGRKTGGVLTGMGKPPLAGDALHAELELRPIDMQGYVSVPFPNGASVQLAGRYGYPGLAIKAFDPTFVLQYWDYQLRAFVPAGRGRTLSVIAVGSFDLIGERKSGKLSRDLSLQFHRVEARAVSRRGGITLGSALGAGYEQSGLGDDLDIRVLRVGPRLWLETDVGPSHLRVGADMLATLGRVAERMRQAGGSTPSDNLLTQLQDPNFAAATGRNVIGLHAETQTQLAQRWRLNAGLRSDVWLTGAYVEVGVEPRLSIEHAVSERLRWHAAVGLANQPVSFPIPLPGIADAVLQRGLQRSVQSELGARLELPSSFSAELTGYFNYYRGLLTFDALTGVNGDDCDMLCSRRTPRVDALAYGMEVMLRRSYKERLSGWVAYTLGKASESNSAGTLRPDFDVRHVLNAVFQWRLSKRWQLSLRALARSGRYQLDANFQADPREQRRLPGFVRGDMQFSRTWPRRWGELRLTFDWLNFTLQREATSWDCDDVSSHCKTSNAGFPVTVPMIGLRGTH